MATGNVEQGGRDDGISESGAGFGNVRRQLLRDQEQEGDAIVAGRGRSGPQHLREGRQVDAQNRLPVVGDPQHFVQRSEVCHQTHRKEGAGFRLFRAASAHQQAHLGPLHGQPRAVHAASQAGHDRGATDEGPGPGGATCQNEGTV